MNQGCAQKRPDPPRASRTRWVPKRLPDPANLPKPRWQDALRALVGPALRIHRYRDLHAQALQDALNKLDAHRPDKGDNGE